jgi:hypothetical protein
MITRMTGISHDDGNCDRAGGAVVVGIAVVPVVSTVPVVGGGVVGRVVTVAFSSPPAGVAMVVGVAVGVAVGV